MEEIRNMRKIALLAFGALVASGFATAALADTMAETYGNTVLATNDKGETSKLWFKAALLPQGWSDSVRIEVRSGLIALSCRWPNRCGLNGPTRPGPPECSH